MTPEGRRGLQNLQEASEEIVLALFYFFLWFKWFLFWRKKVPVLEIIGFVDVINCKKKNSLA